MNLNLPGQSTTLIGRETEVAEIRAQLADPACRLLTLLGPGGIGKTRLALEVAAQMEGFADGIYFVPLQPVASVEQLVPAIAAVTGLPLAGKAPLLTQLLHNLSQKQMLLILDNFEHLLPAASLLVEVLREAPAVKLLVTSREVVGIREEWLYPIQGLSIPPTNAAMNAAVEPADYGAIQLFCTRARQVRRDFSWKSEREDVTSICRQVEGNPLAVELAASWLATLDSAAIAAQLRQGLDILTSSLRDVPERHRSMRVVFDHSWQLLNDAQRAIFSRLTVFQGGFTLAAAQAVAGATLSDLSALVAKSLIRHERELSGRGRYQMHELLRQYGAEKTATSPEAATAAYMAHAVYFLAYLRERHSMYLGGEQLRAIQEIEAEYENALAAWHWSVDRVQTREQAEAIYQAVRALYQLYQLRGRYLEGAERLADAISRLEKNALPEVCGVTLAECLLSYGWLAIRLGRLAEAEQTLTRAYQIHVQVELSPDNNALHVQSAFLILAFAKGDYALAATLAQELRLRAEERREVSLLPVAYYGAARAARAQGEYEQARQYAEQGLAWAMSIGFRWMLIHVHDVLGQVAFDQGDLQMAKRHFELAYAISAEFGAPGIMALHLKNLGDVTARQQQWPEARTFYRQSLTHCQDIGDRSGAAAAEHGLGIASYQVGDLHGARRHLRQALDTAVATQSLSSMLPILAGAGEFLVERAGTGREQALGLRLLRFVMQHPSCDRLTYEGAAACLQRRGAAHGEAPGDTLERLTASLQAELTLVAEAVLSLPSADSFVPVEPLTAREAEVLKLLAAGRSNLEIAGELIIAIGTVKAHTSTIYRKLDVSNRAQAVARAHELSLLG
jgi:predicted ATPase/DNA-binding CsgD family transcriptional regulator